MTPVSERLKQEDFQKAPDQHRLHRGTLSWTKPTKQQWKKPWMLGIIVWYYSWGDINKYLLTPDRKQTTDQSRIPLKSNWCANEFTRITYRSVGEGLITITEITQKQLHCQSLYRHGWQPTKAGNLECTENLQVAQQVRDYLFQVVLMVWECNPFCLYMLGDKGD